MTNFVLSLLAIAMLAGCATSGPITNNPLPSGKFSREGSALNIAEGFREVKFNLEGAVTIGALPADDPALGCVTQVMKDLGIDQGTESASFDPKTETLLGRAAVLYIRVQQAQRLVGGGHQAPVECEALIGKMIVDFGRAIR